MPRTAQQSSSLRADRSDSSLRSRTIEVLRDAIIDLRFEPGERLTENRLCEMTGVSRTTIREALRQLEAEGMVTIKPHVGPTVAEISAKEIGEIYEVRAVLEGLAIGLFVDNAPDADLEKLAEALERLSPALKQPDGQRHIKALDKFYEIMFRSCGNSFVARLTDSIRTRVHYIRTMSSAHYDARWTKQTLINYQRLAQALEGRDRAGAEDALGDQIRHAAKLAQKAVTSTFPRNPHTSS